MTREEAIYRLKTDVYKYADFSENPNEDEFWNAFEMAIKALEQEQKIKVLNRNEAIKKLGTVDIYQASAWVTLLNDLEHLGLRLCEVKE